MLATDFEDRLRRGNSGAKVQHLGVSVLNRLLSDPTGEKTIRLMDRAGINQRVIAILDWELSMGPTTNPIDRIHREILAVCRKFPGRLIGFAGIDPRRVDALQIVRQALDSLGARGIKLHPTSEWALDDDRVDSIVECAVTRRVPVLVHVGRTMPLLSEYHAQPDALVRLAQRFPTVTFIAGHAGFESWARFRELSTPGNIVFDVAGWQDFRADSVSRAAAIRELVRAYPKRVCFGTDSPFFTLNLLASETSWIQAIHSCGLEPAELADLLGATGLKDVIDGPY